MQTNALTKIDAFIFATKYDRQKQMDTYNLFYENGRIGDRIRLYSFMKLLNQIKA